MVEEINWVSLPLQEVSMKMAKYYDSDYVIALEKTKNLTDKFFEHLKLISKSKLNLIMSSFGVQGSGKSWQIIYIVEKLLKYKGMDELPTDNICFTIASLLKVVENLKIGDVFILDEQVHTAGYGSHIERNILENVEMTTRAHKLCFFFLAPRFFVHNYHFFLETWQIGSDKEWSWNKPVEEQWKYTKSVLYDHKNHMLGYIITGTPENKEFMKKYDEKKNEFIEQVRLRRGSGRHQYILDKAYMLLENDTFLRRFVQSRTRRLKRLNMIIALKGELISVEESNMLLDYISWVIEEEPKFRKKADKIMAIKKSKNI